MTLIDFLLARIAEDERDARARLQNGEPHHAPVPWKCPTAHRVLAECEAKRRIMEALDESVNSNSRDPSGLGIGSRLLGLLDAVHYLALPYADHADYREEWRL